MAIAMAVFPVPGWPPIKTALPAIFPYLIISRMIPAAFLAYTLIMSGNLPGRPYPLLFFWGQVIH